uniref:Retrotransposon gag domain-containing protein n=1 Tax=Spongospora subterranea TaxID=70186 RepID=A0A0H5R3Y1_9EUKA|eukprot:CRZ08621.1 hypothetical protein [Spongospora subterranea]
MYGSACSTLTDFSTFITAITTAFDDPDRVNRAADALRRLTMVNDQLGKYSNEFRLLAQDVDWTQSTFIHQYRQGLSPDLQRMLILAEGTGNPFNTLDHLVTTTTALH